MPPILVDFSEETRRQAELVARYAPLMSRLQERTEQVRALTAALSAAGQEQRQEVAQQLYDELEQLLAGIRQKIAFIQEDLEAAERDLHRPGREDAFVWLAPPAGGRPYQMIPHDRPGRPEEEL